MAKKKQDRRRQKAIAKKSSIQTLEFLTMWGLKQLGYGDGGIWQTDTKNELNCVDQLGLTDDLLQLKQFIDQVKQQFGHDIMAGRGDFTKSIVCLGLGISRIEGLDSEIESTDQTWEELIDKKLLTIYFTGNSRNEIVAWARCKGFTMSTYLGQPMLKLNKIFVQIK